MKKQSAERLESLNDLLSSRKQFEADVNEVEHWLKEAEVSLSAEIRASNVGLLEEQLAKVNLELLIQWIQYLTIFSI